MRAPEDSSSRLTRGLPSTGSNPPIDFFISYSPADERWARWVAWQLEAAGYRTLSQVWDFVPGINFIDFMDRGVRDATVVVAVLSRNYRTSRYGTMEWQAALRTDRAKLITVRIEDCPLDGLLATITWVDLVGVTDPDVAAELLLSRLRQALAGRAKPAHPPEFPGQPATGVPAPQPDAGAAAPARPDQPAQAHQPARTRRIPVTAPPYPPAAPTPQTRRAAVTLLHLPGPRFGRTLAQPPDTAPYNAADLQSRIWANVTHLTDNGAPHPDLILVTGDLMESGRPREREEALEFLTGLRTLLGLEPDRLLVVPGSHDVSTIASRAYFLHCEDRDEKPQPPHFPKLAHYAQLFSDLYQGLDGPLFDIAQPWTLFAVPELRVVVAGLNSTMAVTHRPEDDYGWIGDAQAVWFAKQLRHFEETGWLRVGILRHDPDPGRGPVGADPALLRDAGTLDRLLGPRLNLLLHGPGPGGPTVDFLGSGLAVVPGLGAGREEIIEVTRDGLRRFSAYGSNAGQPPVPVQRTWHAVDGVFPPAAAQRPAVDSSAPPPEPAPTTDPQCLLLDRIEEVCDTRYQRIRIRRVETDPPHLLITRQEEDFNPQWRVGAHVGRLSRDVVEGFLSYQPGPGSELVYDGPAPAAELREEAQRRGVRLRSFLEFQGLLDLTGYLERQTDRLRADPVYPPELYVPQRFRELSPGDHAVRPDLATELVRLVTTEYPRFLLVLGNAGRGKTFLLHEVARRIAETAPHLIPILIELRALDKTHTVQGLVAAHLANHGEGLPNLKAFDYMLREGRLVLLFDGFDELVTRLTYDRAAEHLHTLLDAAQDRAKIIVASRTEHFKSDAQVFTTLGERIGLLPHRRILTIESFTTTEIRSYLINRYDGDQRKADARLNMMASIQNLLELSQNPRMLSFIAALDDDQLRAAADARHTISAAGLYRKILGCWLSYEAKRTSDIPGVAVGLRLEHLWQAVTTLALRLWETGESHLQLAELTEVAETLVGLTDHQLSPDQTAFALGTGSLLVRTEEGPFGFIHRSVGEWLVANMIAQQLISGGPAPVQLHQRALSPLCIEFLCDLAGTQACRSWVESLPHDAGKAAKGNAIKLGARLRTAPTADLRGAQLKGADLSYRDLREADLTGADLSDAVLVGANLTGAILRNCRLVGAQLDEARLTRADLSAADLSRARLFRADLTGTIRTGSRWTRAALIDATGVAADAPELRGAAVAPGTAISAEFAPAWIGVRHGFDAAMGRLPQVLDYSHDGGLLAIGSDDGGVLIYDPMTGAPLRTLQGHRGRVFAVTYGEDVLVTGSDDGTVRIWDALTGQCRHVLPGHRKWSWPVVISPSGQELATGDADGVLRLWNLGSGSQRCELPTNHGLIFSLAFSGRLIAVAYQQATVLLGDTTTGTWCYLDGVTSTVYRAVFSPTGDLLATSGQCGAIQLWDPSTGRRLAELTGHTGRVYGLAFHPSEPLLVSGDTDGGVRVWDTTTRRVRHTLTGHDAALYWVTFNPTGDLVATGDSAGAVRLWDTTTGRLRHELSGHTGSVWPFVFRRDGGQLAISDDQFTTRLWDPATGQCRHTLTGHGRQVTSVRFSADSSVLAASGSDGEIRLWDPRTGQELRRLAGIDSRLVRLENAIFSPSGHRLVTVSNDGRLNLLNLDTDRYERHLTIESAPVWAVAFSPSGEELATANDDDTVQLWYCATGRLVHTLAEHRGRVRSIAFSSDGSLLATGCDDSKVRLWDARSGQLLQTLAGHGDRVYAVDFGNGLLASASWDTTARVWDIESGQTRYELSQHTGRLWTAAFHPGGDLLATAGDDLVIRLWDPRSGQLLHTLAGHTRSVWSVTFNPAGDLLATGSDDGTTRLWSVDTEQPELRVTLLGLPEGWAALAPDGRYKLQGDVGGQFWHAINMRRFETGELNHYLPGVRHLTLEKLF
ncbi:MAG: TIR domain-containing protein [Pseudonocardiaceae bacterium]